MSFTILPGTLSLTILPREMSRIRTLGLLYTVREANGAEYKVTLRYEYINKSHGAYRVPTITPAILNKMTFGANCNEKVFRGIKLTAEETKRSEGWFNDKSIRVSKVLVKAAPLAVIAAKPAAPPPAASAELIAQNKRLQDQYNALSSQVAAGGRTLASVRAEATRLMEQLRQIEGQQAEFTALLRRYGLE